MAAIRLMKSSLALRAIFGIQPRLKGRGWPILQAHSQETWVVSQHSSLDLIGLNAIDNPESKQGGNCTGVLRRLAGTKLRLLV